MSQFQKFTEETADHIEYLELVKKFIDEGTNRYVFSRFEIYKKEIGQELPDEETQVQESLRNLASGNYRDVSIEQYLKELDE